MSDSEHGKLGRPAALVFDMDGLLLDTEAVYKRAWTLAAAELGFDLTDELFLELIGITIADCERVLVQRFGPTFPLDEFRVRAAKSYDAILDADGIPLKPGVRELLAWATDKGIPCGVGTSTVTEEAIQRLERHDLSRSFGVVIGGDQVSHGKPNPEIFLKVAAALGVDPGRSLVLEDAHSGVRAAHAGGFRVILVPDLLPPTAEIADLSEEVFDSLAQVLRYLNDLELPTDQ